jgi:tRNA threonylcarbamoyladenosine biosynthesis protein TsaB
MKMLAIDTSSLTASAALTDGDTVVFGGSLENGFTHSRSLMPLVESAMNLAGWRPEELEGLAVTAGPGSFTGLRIGVAAVKGMALTLDVPVAAVSTLHALAAGCGPVSGLVAPVMDARRGQVYTALFEAEPVFRRLSADRAAGVEELLAELSGREENVLFTGDGVRTYGEKLLAALNGRGRIAPPPLRMPRAAAVAMLGAAMIDRGETCDPRTLVPRYLRGSLARPIWEQPRRADGNGR